MGWLSFSQVMLGVGEPSTSQGSTVGKPSTTDTSEFSPGPLMVGGAEGRERRGDAAEQLSLAREPPLFLEGTDVSNDAVVAWFQSGRLAGEPATGWLNATHNSWSHSTVERAAVKGWSGIAQTLQTYADQFNCVNGRQFSRKNLGTSCIHAVSPSLTCSVDFKGCFLLSLPGQ